jgi:ABC-2 type transport system ATP-binding protein
VAGEDVLRQPDRVRRVIGVVAQRSGADPVATGRENLVLQCRVYGLTGGELRRRVSSLLERFGLAEAANRPVKTYSGGMQRRLDIALGMVHHPPVLFLDEPTTGLDPEVRSEMWDEIARLAADGTTVLLTTHYLDEADRLADRLVIVDRGRLVAEGTPEELKAALRGDAISAELTEPADERVLHAALTGVDGVVPLNVDGRLVHARVAVGATAVPAVLSALESRGIRVASVTVARPSLDDVYLQHTGRSFAAADTEAIR